MSLFKRLFNVREPLTMDRPRSLAADQPEPHRFDGGADREVQVDIAASNARFYDLLFGARARASDKLNRLEQLVLDGIASQLGDPELLANKVVRLPRILVRLRELLRDPDTGMADLEALVNQDAALAADVVRMANGPLFRTGSRELTSLKAALVAIGTEGTAQVVTAALAAQLYRIKPIYFRLFGEKVWQHALLTAVRIKALAKGQGLDGDSLYLAGLIQSLGHVVIFRLLVDAFEQEEPGVQPDSLLFRRLMRQKGKQISALLAGQWQLPAELCGWLEEQMLERPVSREGRLLKLASDQVVTLMLFREGLIQQSEYRALAVELEADADDLLALGST
ncbi:HDOD domain-containing protein [Gallaecimonas sp. GXIMD4217]|uniref:HDOD domain-containing protein n=1 Tax=Gallaecimonas sp. GXIMD4217 TaxID=3131927 RepID=UPI00311AF178